MDAIAFCQPFYDFLRSLAPAGNALGVLCAKLLGGLPLSPSSKRPWPYASLGVTVARVMTDNGSCYGSRMFQKACKWLGLKHIRTKPYTPKTNGKAVALHSDQPAFPHVCVA